MNTISLLLDSSKSGGIESHVKNLAKALHQRGLKVQVIVWKQYNGQTHPLEEQMRNANVPFHYANGRFSTLISLVKKGSIVHSHGYKANLLAKLGNALGKWYAFPTHHNGDLGEGWLKWYVLLDEITSRLFSPISVSNDIFQRLGNRGLKVKNFVFPPEQGNANSSKLERPLGQIAFVGRISEEKDPEAFCRIGSAIMASQQNPPCSFHVYGSGAEQDQLKAKYPQIVFHGEQDMSRHWPDIDLLCITSKTEGLPLAALEAMSQSIPVISFAVGDLPKLIRHGNNGWLVPKGEHNVMKETLLNWEKLSPKSRNDMKCCAYETIKRHYSAHAVLPTLLNHYQQKGKR